MMRLRRHVTFKSIFGIVLLLVLFSLIVSAIGYNTQSIYNFVKFSQ